MRLPSKVEKLEKMCQRAKLNGHIGHMKQRNTPNILMVLNISQKKVHETKSTMLIF